MSGKCDLSQRLFTANEETSCSFRCWWIQVYIVRTTTLNHLRKTLVLEVKEDYKSLNTFSPISVFPKGCIQPLAVTLLNSGVVRGLRIGTPVVLTLPIHRKSVNRRLVFILGRGNGQENFFQPSTLKLYKIVVDSGIWHSKMSKRIASITISQIKKKVKGDLK